MAKPINKESVAALATHAYLQLVNVRWSSDGARSTVLAKYSRYEVRLIEFVPVANKNVSFLWIELHDVGTQTTVDSFGCDDFEGVIQAAEQVIAQAKRLADNKGEAPS